MKNYKFIVPVVLVVFFVLSVFTLYKNNLEVDDTYNQAIERAKSYAEKGLTTDAMIYYQDAMNIQPSLDLNWEIIRMFEAANEISFAKTWVDITINNYPYDAKAYEWSFEQYYKTENYAACYEILEKASRRSIHSEYLNQMEEEIKYAYFLYDSYDGVGDYANGYCAVCRNGLWGYIDTTGKKVIDYQYLSAGMFSTERAPVIDEDDGAYFIDNEGRKRIIAYGLDEASAFGELVGQVYAVSNGKKWGYFTTNDEWLFGGFDFDYVSAFNSGIAAVRNGDKWSLVNRSGEIVGGAQYDNVALNTKNMVYCNGAFVKKDNKYILIDADGNPITDTAFEDAKAFNDDTYAAVKMNGKWGFVNTSGEVVIEAQYEEARSFSCGWAAVKVDGKWGFISMSGDITIKAEFDNAKDLNDSGCVMVYDGISWSLLKLYKYNY